MKREWTYLSNTFLIVTEGSYRKMKQVGDFTRAALAAAVASGTDPAAKEFFQSLVDAIGKPVDEYGHAYVLWLELLGAQKGQTRSLTNLLSDLSGMQAEDWDLAIQNVYRQNTAQYMALMPRHRIPFQRGSQQDRITAVGALSIALDNDPKLKDLNDKVDAVYDQLVLANNTQKGSKSTKSGGSAEVEAARIKLAVALYGILGLLMNYYKETPEAIASYFLIQQLRERDQTEWEHDLKGGEQRVAFTRTFANGEMLLFANTGNAGLRLARVSEKNDPMPQDALLVPAGEDVEVLPDTLGAPGSRFYIVKNESATEEGRYRVVIE